MNLNSLRNIRDLPFHEGGKIVHFSTDSYGRVLVIESGDRRILNFDSLFEQSCMQISQPYQLVHQYTQLMVMVLALIDPTHITVFGLGGGSLLRTLHFLLPECAFKVVELRKVVVDIAREYFLSPDCARVEISVDDTFKVISRADSGCSDIIFSDMYDAYRMVPGQIQRSFLAECSRVLSDRGWLVMNLHQVPGDRSTFFGMMNDIFPTVILSATSENTVLFAGKSPFESIKPNVTNIKLMEEALNQKLKHLLHRLQPINCRLLI